MPRLHYRKDLKTAARKLRSGLTDAEACLWRHVRRRQLLGVQFLRQRPIGSYIVDFLAPSVRLAIELDGGQHFEDGHAARDAQRDGQLAALGFTVLRFTNLEVLTETPNVVEAIYQAVVHAKENPPRPPFFKGGGGRHGATA